MPPEEDHERFRKLPEAVPPEEMVETLDVTEHPTLTDGDDRDRLLRDVGAP